MDQIKSILVGVAVAFAGFWLNQGWIRHREKKAKYEKLIGLLKAGIAEIEFHRGKLQFIHTNLASEQFFVPNFDITPQFLQTLKSDFLTSTHTAHLIPFINDLHFRLIHIQNWVTKTRSLQFNDKLLSALNPKYSHYKRRVTVLSQETSTLCDEVTNQLQITLKTIANELNHLQKDFFLASFVKDFFGVKEF